MLHLGFAKVDITPPLCAQESCPIPILGFWWERAKPYLEIHDPLFARAMVVNGGKEAAAIISCDTFGDGIGFGDQAAQRIEREQGIPADRVLVHSTHTHTAPETIGLCDKSVDSRWTDKLIEGIVQAVAEAKAGLFPARLKYRRARTEGISVNRRAATVRKRLEENKELLTESESKRLCWHDPAIQVLAAEDSSGQVRGNVVGLACHPIIMQTAPMISSDFAGPAMAFLEKKIGKGSVCLFLNGAAGDINPSCHDTRNYADVISIARKVSTAAANALTQPGMLELESSVTVARLELPFPRRQVRPQAELSAQIDSLHREMLAKPSSELGQRHPLGRQLFDLKEQLAVAQMPETLHAHVQVLRLGRLTFAGFPGELFACLGQDVRDAVTGPVLVAGYANRYLGYLCPREGYLLGGYESLPARWCPLAEGAGELARDAAIELARRL